MILESNSPRLKPLSKCHVYPVLCPWKVAENNNKLWCAKAAYVSRFDLPSEVSVDVQQKLDEIRKKGTSNYP